MKRILTHPLLYTGVLLTLFAVRIYNQRTVPASLYHHKKYAGEVKVVNVPLYLKKGQLIPVEFDSSFKRKFTYVEYAKVGETDYSARIR